MPLRFCTVFTSQAKIDKWVVLNYTYVGVLGLFLSLQTGKRLIVSVGHYGMEYTGSERN